jgi:hypothetical protein
MPYDAMLVKTDAESEKKTKYTKEKKTVQQDTKSR